MPLPSHTREAILNNPNLLHILKLRIEKRLNRLRSQIYNRLPEKVLEDLDLDKMERWLEYHMDKITDKVLARFEKELRRYEKKNGSSYLEDIEKAWNKDKFPQSKNDADRLSAMNWRLCRLITWDKAWITIKEVQERILEAQESGDFAFIKDFGEALAKQPGCCPKPKIDAELAEILRTFADRHPMETQAPQFRRGMHDYLYTENGDKVREDDPKEIDFDYFDKWLKRHDVI